MSISTKLGDEFLRIPKLDVSGSNWVIYKERFTWALDARGIANHIDETGEEPLDPLTEAIRKTETGLSAEQQKQDIEWKKELKEWKTGEAVAKQQIASSIPDSLFLKIRTNGSAFKIWKALEDHFQKRSQMVAIDLRRRIQNQRCGDKDDIVAHFATLRTMREDLASMGQKLEDTDFYAIVMGSLPTSYDPYISAVNATSSVLGKTLSADDLILTVTKEYERRTLKAKSGKKDADNAAFHSSDAGKDQKGGQKRKGDCHNCGKKGHWMRDCYAEGGGKEGQGPKQKGKGKGKGKGEDKEKDKKDDKETASAAETSKKDEKPKDEEAWMATVLDDDDVVVLEALESDPCDIHDDLDDDWCPEEAYSCFIDEDLTFDHIAPDISNSLGAEEDFNAGNEHINIPTNISTNFEYAYLVKTTDTRKLEVDLYNSGATRHMSGFFHKFVNFVRIEPIPITAADKRTFQAIGKGDMYVNIPNRSHKNSRILLKDVLYAPSMGVTLISISKIAGAGSTVVFTRNSCRIYNKDRNMIGEIKVKGGLYRVHYSASGVEGYSAQTNEILTVDELHRRLGHVSHDRPRLEALGSCQTNFSLFIRDEESGVDLRRE